MAQKGMTEFRSNGEDFTINDPNIADEFNVNKAYEAGECAYYQGDLYIFITKHVPGTWNISHVRKFKVGDELLNRTYTAYPKTYNPSDYTQTVNLSSFLISDRIIPAGSVIKGLRFYFFSASNVVYIAVLNASTRVVKKVFYTSGKVGWNTEIVNYQVEEDSVIGIYGHGFKAHNTYVDTESSIDYGFSTGWIEGSTKPPAEGSTVTVTTYDTNVRVCLPIEWFISEPNAPHAIYDMAEAEEAESDTKVEGTSITAPFVKELDFYTISPNTSSFLISDREIPAGSFVRAVKTYFHSNSTIFYIYLIDKVSHKVVYKKTANAYAGWNVIPINYFTEADCLVGIYGHAIRGRLQDATLTTPQDMEYVFSNGYIEGDVKPAFVGDTITLNQYGTNNNIYLSIQWIYSTANNKYIEPESDKAIYSEVTQQTDRHGPLVSFIDDDSGIYVPDIWGQIISETGIRMGFACITGYMSGQVTPTSPRQTQMTLAELKEFYNAGHEVYSHSWSHPAFYEATLPQIEEECIKSKMWLENNGFVRGADMIVYPGGMGRQYIEQRKVVKRFFKYGVDVQGSGVNTDEDIISNPYLIIRINGDTGTLEELKAAADRAVSQNALLVFMNHAYEMNPDRDNQIAKMIALIQYIQAQNGKIMPLGEALHLVRGW